MANCNHCGVVIPNNKANLTGLCEACKWQDISHNPLSGDPAASLATAGALRTALGPRVKATSRTNNVDPRVNYHPIEQNLSMALVAGLAAGALAAGLWYLLVTNTHDTAFYAAFLIGMAIAAAMDWGNNHNATWTLELCTAAVTVIVVMAAEIFTYRYLLVHGLGNHGLMLQMPLLMNKDQVQRLFEPGLISGPAWWVAPMVAVAGTFAYRILVSQRR